MAAVSSSTGGVKGMMTGLSRKVGPGKFKLPIWGWTVIGTGAAFAAYYIYKSRASASTTGAVQGESPQAQGGGGSGAGTGAGTSSSPVSAPATTTTTSGVGGTVQDAVVPAPAPSPPSVPASPPKAAAISPGQEVIQATIVSVNKKIAAAAPVNTTPAAIAKAQAGADAQISHTPVSVVTKTNAAAKPNKTTASSTKTSLTTAEKDALALAERAGVRRW
jgi:hypothetical protein